MKELILETVDDLVIDFMLYDRKEDEELNIDNINDAIKNGIITKEEIINQFSKRINEWTLV